MVKSDKEIMDNLRKEFFVNLSKLSLPQNISKEDIRDYFKHKFGVDSFTKFSEKEWCYVTARVRAASTDFRILQSIVKKVKEFKGAK